MGPTRNSTGLTRRQFVAAGALGGALVAAGCESAGNGNWEFLTENQARALAAICDQIIPADDFPSASQVGVLNYIDRQLARHYRRHRQTYTDGLNQTEELSRQRFAKEITALAADQQHELVAAIEQRSKAFFNLVRAHTMEGYYGSPRHGGNRDAVSWRMLGLQEPPTLGRAQYDLHQGQHS